MFLRCMKKVGNLERLFTGTAVIVFRRIFSAAGFTNYLIFLPLYFLLFPRIGGIHGDRFGLLGDPE